MSLQNINVEKRLKTRILYCVLLILLGIASLIISMGDVLPLKISEYVTGFYTGIGFALIASGILTIVRNVRILKDPALLKERSIYENDERNRMISLKTWSYAGYAMFILLYAGMLVAAFISELVLNTLLVTLGVYALCIFFAGVYCKKTM
ncbi:MAG: hypothetical protein II994_02825 [Lachnospiraceae bacterium]|nr:hypothetical protein [Lachnospiraceae bacterium]